MTDQRHIMQTFVGTETVAPVEIWSGSVRDQLILIRDAVHALRTQAASEIELSVQVKEWTMTVKVRR